MAHSWLSSLPFSPLTLFFAVSLAVFCCCSKGRFKLIRSPGLSSGSVSFILLNSLSRGFCFFSWLQMLFLCWWCQHLYFQPKLVSCISRDSCELLNYRMSILISLPPLSSTCLCQSFLSKWIVPPLSHACRLKTWNKPPFYPFHVIPKLLAIYFISVSKIHLYLPALFFLWLYSKHPRSRYHCAWQWIYESVCEKPHHFYFLFLSNCSP